MPNPFSIVSSRSFASTNAPQYLGLGDVQAATVGMGMTSNDVCWSTASEVHTLKAVAQTDGAVQMDAAVRVDDAAQMDGTSFTGTGVIPTGDDSEVEVEVEVVVEGVRVLHEAAMSNESLAGGAAADQREAVEEGEGEQAETRAVEKTEEAAEEGSAEEEEMEVEEEEEMEVEEQEAAEEMAAAEEQEEEAVERAALDSGHWGVARLPIGTAIEVWYEPPSKRFAGRLPAELGRWFVGVVREHIERLGEALIHRVHYEDGTRANEDLAWRSKDSTWRLVDRCLTRRSGLRLGSEAEGPVERHLTRGAGYRSQGAGYRSQGAERHLTRGSGLRQGAKAGSRAESKAEGAREGRQHKRKREAMEAVVVSRRPSVRPSVRCAHSLTLTTTFALLLPPPGAPDP